jgi:hypothetical protein
MMKAAAVFILVAFAMGDRMKEVEPGMSEAQVVQKLGRPNGFQVKDNCKSLTYTNRLVSIWSMDHADFYVVVCDGKVTQTGNGDVRQWQNPNRFLFIMPGL